jgi:starch phosphorylase
LDYTPAEISKLIEMKLMSDFSCEPGDACKEEFYKAVCMVMRDILSSFWLKNHDVAHSHNQKQVYYMSMEFLPGRSLRNNLFNFHLEDIFHSAIADFGLKLDDLYEMDPDAGLGNGGLGRLASCYLDALATAGMAGHGMSICYEYGIFRQKIVNGMQKEEADNWLDLGNVWLLKKEDETEQVRFGGKLEENWVNGRNIVSHTGYTTVLAVPYDFHVSGYDSEVVNSLRLYKATSPVQIDMELFAQGQYLKSMEQKYLAEVISKILYPEDTHTEGKRLRLTQQYFFTSAAMQGIVRRHLLRFGTLDNLNEKVAVHINDTHPSMVIPELMRILLDEQAFDWDKAWEIVKKTVSYTNHTILPEALERWPIDLFNNLLPRIYSIIAEIDRRLMIDLLKAFPDVPVLREQMAILHQGELRMANLCVASSHSVNGVSALHSKILKDEVFNGYYRISPEKFTNVTNGIAYRRWLCQANPLLCGFIEELCGPGFRKNAAELEKLSSFKEDISVLSKLEEIKKQNKILLSNCIRNSNGISVDPDSIFDVQAKRLHEYKRQLMNLLHIMHLYLKIKDDPDAEIQPRTFIFAAKAAAGYYMAKQIISLACHLAVQINKDPVVRDRIKIVFMENYSVSLSEKIMPAADVSEQISLAGMEASGTGNMKLMINGAVTIGTMDGANIEIFEAVGPENIFIFGLRKEEVESIIRQGTYNSSLYLQNHSNVNRVLEFMMKGIDGIVFTDIINSLTSYAGGMPDHYFIMADFESYRETQEKISVAWKNHIGWDRMSLMNIAKAGIFSADRSIGEYADRIWNIAPIV